MAMARDYLIVGLGNPGKDYEYTRHNLGFLVVERIAEAHKLKFLKSSLTNALMAQVNVDDNKLHLLMPLTYMNNSGVAVKKFVMDKQLDAGDVLVVADDMNLDFGHLRLRKDGSSGGHNGIQSIIDHLKTKNFARLRLGIGRPRQGQDPVDFVLEKFTKSEKEKLKIFSAEASDCCFTWLNEGVTKAMNLFNERKE